MRSVAHRSYVSILLIAAAGVFLLGCGRGSETAAPVTIRIGLGAPEGGRTIGLGGIVSVLTADPWLGSRPDGRPLARIATDWSWDEAGTTLRLKLRRDVYFHDGTRLTPEIATLALRKTAEDPSTRPYSFTSVSSIAPNGDDGVDIHLKERNAFVLPDLTGVVVVKPENPTQGTGPFHLDKGDQNGASLSAFPRYYRGHPVLAGITITKYPTQRSAWTALMRSDVDMLYEVSRDAADLVAAETAVKSYSFPRPYYIPLVFNVRRPVLRDPEVRKAINEAIDREALVRDGMSGRGRPADGPIWPQHWSYSPPAEPFTFNPAAAKLRLDKAGLRGHLVNGTMAPRLTFTCLVFADDSRFERIATLVQKQLADVGIDMKLVPARNTELMTRLQSGDFDAFVFEMAGRSLGWVYQFWHFSEGGMLNTGYRAADPALDRIRGSLTDDDVKAGVTELQRVLHDDPPAAFLTWQTQTRAVSTKFDVATEDNHDIMANIWQWRPADPAKAGR